MIGRSGSLQRRHEVFLYPDFSLEAFNIRQAGCPFQPFSLSSLSARQRETRVRKRGRLRAMIPCGAFATTQTTIQRVPMWCLNDGSQQGDDLTVVENEVRVHMRCGTALARARRILAGSHQRFDAAAFFSAM